MIKGERKLAKKKKKKAAAHVILCLYDFMRIVLSFSI